MVLFFSLLLFAPRTISGDSSSRAEKIVLLLPLNTSFPPSEEEKIRERMLALCSSWIRGIYNGKLFYREKRNGGEEKTF